MAQCIRCGKRAAKRFCPALNTKICALCCARERMMELACPESCQYLQEARDQTMERERAIRTKELMAEGKTRFDVDRRALEAVFRIYDAIAYAHRETFHDLKDIDIAMAVENLIKNLETEDSGLIYEHHADSPRIQQMSRRLREALETKVGQELAPESLRRGDKMKALEMVLDDARAHIKRNQEQASESRSYVRYISLFVPWPEEATSPLIISP